MIEYIAEFLGCDAAALMSPFGLALAYCFIAVFAYALIKVILYWFELFFGRW